MSQAKDWFPGAPSIDWDPPGADYEHEAERTGARRATRVLAAILGIFLAAAVVIANAAPSVANREECALVGDVVLVAAALQKHDVPAEKRAPILQDTYRNALGGGEAKKWREILELAMRFVRRDVAKGIEPQDLANAVAQACDMGRGNLEPIFGAES